MDMYWYRLGTMKCSSRVTVMQSVPCTCRSRNYYTDTLEQPFMGFSETYFPNRLLSYFCYCYCAFGSCTQVEIVDNNPEYGHVEEGDVGEVVDNNPAYGH